jgi:hypothetical protein
MNLDTTRTARLGGLGIIVLALAGCAAGASPSPSLPTLPPASVPALPSGLPSIDPSAIPSITLPSSLPSGLPSMNADADLEAQLPDEVGGQALQKVSFAGSEFLGTGNPQAAEFEALLQRLSKTADDFTFAVAGGAAINISAFKIEGTDSNQLLQSILDTGANRGMVVAEETRGGKAITKLTPPTGPVQHYYTKGDVVFVVQSPSGNAALIDEAISKLP